MWDIFEFLTIMILFMLEPVFINLSKILFFNVDFIVTWLSYYLQITHMILPQMVER